MRYLAPFAVGVVLVGLAIWFLPIGGIEQIVNSATAHPVDALGIAVGAVRTMFTGLGIWAGVAIALALGAYLDG
jgi:hypothetical protein